MSARADELIRFIARIGWAHASCEPLPRDASFRQYHRLRAEDGTTALVMDSPPDREPLTPFVQIAARLRDLGLSAPRVLAADCPAGFALIEDFGLRTYSRALADGADEAGLYQAATDLLIALHRTNPQLATDGVPEYSDYLLNRELSVFIDWYLPECLDPAARTEAAAAFLPLWAPLYAVARLVPDHLVLRDFHVDNLMDLPTRPGVRAVGLLDFQDAVRGPRTYDFVSLVGDARRDVDPVLRAACRARYLAAAPALDADIFDASAAILSAQRNFKILGIFTRQLRRDGRDVYLRHIPRVWRLLDADLAHPQLAQVADWLTHWLPPPVRRVPQAPA